MLEKRCVAIKHISETHGSTQNIVADVLGMFGMFWDSTKTTGFICKNNVVEVANHIHPTYYYW